MKQRYVGAGLDRQVQVRQFAGVCAARVDHDYLHVRPLAFRFFQPTEQHRVGVSHVAANDQHAVAELNVFVVTRWCVGTQAAFVADHCGRHAQPRIAVDIVGADQCSGQFVECVVVLGQQLPGNVKRNAVRAVFAKGVSEHVGSMVKRCVPIGDAARQGFTQAQFRVQRPSRQVAGQVQA